MTEQKRTLLRGSLAHVKQLQSQLAAALKRAEDAEAKCRADSAANHSIAQALAEMQAERDELREVVEKLPVTADGIRFVPESGFELWYIDPADQKVWLTYSVECRMDQWHLPFIGPMLVSKHAFSTREAATQALAESEGGA